MEILPLLPCQEKRMEFYFLMVENPGHLTEWEGAQPALFARSIPILVLKVPCCEVPLILAKSGKCTPECPSPRKTLRHRHRPGQVVSLVGARRHRKPRISVMSVRPGLAGSL